MFKTAQECIEFIENIEKFGMEKGLMRMLKALDLLGNPHLDYKKVLVFGTNGKGSTLSFLKNILMKNNLKVGNYISPYVISFNERVSIGNEYISDDDLIYYSNKVHSIWLKMKEEGDAFTFFEYITILGFLYFKDKKVDIALIEIGIESELDATNVADYELLLHTNVGYDHMDFLGHTLEKISNEQFKLVKDTNHIISSDSNFINQHIKDLKSRNISYKQVTPTEKYKYDKGYLSYLYDNVEMKLKLIGHHQVSNSMLAIEGAKYLIPNIDVKSIQEGLEETFWPGRFERFDVKGKEIIIDGGHNISGINVLVKTLKGIYEKKVEVVFTALKDKQTKEMIESLEEVTFDITFTTFDDPRAKDPNILLEESTLSKKEVILDYKEAINKYLDTNNILVITGSLYFISDVRKYLLKLSK